MDWNWKNTALMGAGTKKAPLLRACRMDQRFSYYLYFPKGFKCESAASYNIAVVVHGTLRTAEKLKDLFVDYANETKTVILAPLFPTGIIEREDIHNYKFIKFHDIRFDDILLDMVDEVRKIFGITQEKFMLHGFSGGGQFSHRMFYLHPERLKAVSIGAPGRATFLDANENWYNGIGDFEEQFGKALNMEELRKVPVLLLIGADDIEIVDYTNDAKFSKSASKHGKNRVERMESLLKNYLDNGLDARMEKVPGIAHEGLKLVPNVITFFKGIQMK